MPSSTPAPRSPARPHAGAALSFPSTSASSSFLSRPGRHISGRQINNLTRTTNKTPSRSASQSNFLARVATPAYGLNTPSANGRRSRAASSIGGSEGHQIICAVSEARGVVPSVGIALINVSTGEAVLSQICDNQSYVKTTQKLTVFEPSKVLIISSACPPSPKSSLCATIEEELPGVPIVPLDRKYWSETAGLELIQALAFKEDVEAIKVAIQGNYYATSAFSAAMKYLELELGVRIAGHSLRVKYQPSEESMMISLPTIQALELIQNLQNSSSKDCLFGLLNETLTPMGARTLRSNILQPSTQTTGILVPRYDALEELCTKEDMFFEIRKALKEFGDVEKLLTKIIVLRAQPSIEASEQAINNVLKIKKFVVAVPDLYRSLAAARCELLVKIREHCRPAYTDITLKHINEVVNEDVTFVSKPLDLRNQRVYAVKSGIQGLLDVARTTYKEATEDLHQHVGALNAELGLAADLKFETNRRYWLRIRVSDLENGLIPAALINCVRKKDFIECQTLQMVKLNQRMTDSVDEAIMQSDKVVQQLLNAIRVQIPHLFRVCESVGLLDMLGSFGQAVTTKDWVKPELRDTLALKAARHPILDSSIEKFIANDYYASERHSLQIITGFNMSGKSTYIRAVALLQIMAQIGCFVPAQYASFTVMHNLFSRTSTDDSIESNLSTFSIEMRDMAFILRNINDKSMVIIDELGRGTSTRDGLAIAISMAEALVQSNAVVFFATHFTELAKVLEDRPGVLNLHLATETAVADDNMPKMTMLYRIDSGPVQEENYGINFARAIGFPEEFLDTAENVTDALKGIAEAKQQSSESHKLARRRKLILNLHEALQQAYESNMDEETLGSYLRRLQSEFISRMEVIERGAVESEAAEVEELENGPQSAADVPRGVSPGSAIPISDDGSSMSETSSMLEAMAG